MGCVNLTCAISNLPICVDDEVIFLVLKQHSRSDILHVNGFWTPELLPIVASYNEYGSIENWSSTETPLFNVMTSYYKENLLEEVESQFHEWYGATGVKRQNVNIENLLAWFVTNNVKTVMFDKEVEHVPVMIHKSIWDKISTGNHGFNSYAFSYDTVIKSLDAFFEDSLKMSEKEIFEFLFFGFAPKFQKDDKTFGWYLNYLKSANNQMCDALISDLYSDMVAAHDRGTLASEVDRFRLLFTRLVQVMFASLYMEEVRLTWHPATGTSQGYSTIPMIEHYLMCIREGLGTLEDVSSKETNTLAKLETLISELKANNTDF